MNNAETQTALFWFVKKLCPKADFSNIGKYAIIKKKLNGLHIIQVLCEIKFKNVAKFLFNLIVSELWCLIKLM